MSYPIGQPGKPWGEAEREEWFSKATVKRSYKTEVLDRLDRVPSSFERTQYGSLSLDPERYPLFFFRSKSHQPKKPAVLITGGVHGYETSGVQGALSFLLHHAEDYADRFNVCIAPCVSPWGYETINRWNPRALDPNRSFYAGSGCEEAEQLMRHVASLEIDFKIHIDLHETTDTDETEFRPALAAKDGKKEDTTETIPDGFYLVDDTERPQPGFQRAMIERVKPVTYIAAPDDDGCMIGKKVLQDGVIAYPCKDLYLCAGMTNAPYVSTTEVYPDSPRATAHICIDAQIAAIKGGLDYVASQGTSML